MTNYTIEKYTSLSDMTREDINMCKRLSFRNNGWLFEVLCQRVPFSTLTVVRDQGMIVGWWCHFYKYMDNHFGFFVRKACRGQGIGRMMIEMAMDSGLVGRYHAPAVHIMWSIQRKRGLYL